LLIRVSIVVAAAVMAAVSAPVPRPMEVSRVSCMTIVSVVVSEVMSERVGVVEPNEVMSELEVSREKAMPSSVSQPTSSYPSGSAVRSPPAPLVRFAMAAAVISATKTLPCNALRMSSVLRSSRAA
jgi:hypothetical protein